jgi:N-acetylneuraminic acid mutarotase
LAAWLADIPTQIDAYDTVANTWSSKEVMPLARADGAGSAVSGYIYFMGGENSGVKNSNYQYKV